MEIQIKETGKIETLTLLDPKSGCCWIHDAVDPSGDILYNEVTEVYECDQDTFDWWQAFATAYQAADYRWHALLQDVDNDTYNDMIEAKQGMEAEFNDYPSALSELCDEWQKKINFKK